MNEHVLVIEDNPDNRKLVTRLLRSEGYHCEGVDTAEEGLARLADGRFDLVLMDISLPRMSGKDATRYMRQDPRFADLPILAVSAHAINTEREAILQSGVSGLLTKPIDADELTAAIRALLRERSPNGEAVGR